MDYYVKEIKENKNKPRIFLDGLQAARAGFSPGDRYDIEIEGYENGLEIPSNSNLENIKLTLIANKDGSRTVTGRMSKKTGCKSIPVIDLNSNAVLGLFEGMSAVRMIVRDGSIVFLPLASELAKKERLDRLAFKVKNKVAVKVGDLTHGVGILAHAIHEGLAKSGVAADMAFVNEIREELIDHSREHNSVWNEGTIAIAAPMQEIIQDQWLMDNLHKVEVLSMSLPCSGASKAGASKLKLKQMEDHEHVGHLVFAALVIISKVQPAVLLLENVKPYHQTASASILRKQLIDMGYHIHEAVLNGKDFGCLESRERWCMVGVTEGLSFDFDQITPPVRIVQKVGDILEQIALDDPMWSSNKGLKAKEIRDIDAGKGFRLPLVTEESTSVPTLRKHYQKKGSCDVQVRHPEDPELARLFTGNEHLNLKCIDHALFGDFSDAMPGGVVSEAMKHQGAGQAVQPPVFIPIGELIGKTIQGARPYSRQSRKAAKDMFLKFSEDGIAYEPVTNVFEITMNAIKDIEENKLIASRIKPKRHLGGGGVG